MKYLKKYSQLNEGLRDKMIGRNIDDILKSYEGKSPEKKLKDGVINNVYELVKIAMEEGAKPTDLSLLMDTVTDTQNVDILNLLISDIDFLHKNILVVKNNKVLHEFIIFLKGIGFNVNPDIYDFYKTSYLHVKSPHTIIVGDFIKMHFEYLRKYNSDMIVYDRTETMNNLIKPNLEKILDKYDLKLDKKEPFSKMDSHLLIFLKSPKVSQNDKKIIELLKDGVDNVDEFYDKIFKNI